MGCVHYISHGDGVFPHFGYISNGTPKCNKENYEVELQALQNRNKAIAKINRVKLDSNIFYLDGISLIKGYECNSYEKIKHKVIFSCESQSYEYPLGKLLNQDLSYHFSESVFCDYTAAKITSIGQKGGDISKLPEGFYTVRCLIEVNNKSTIEDFNFTSNSNTQSIFENKIINAFSKADKLYLSVNLLGVNYFCRFASTTLAALGFLLS